MAIRSNSIQAKKIIRNEIKASNFTKTRLIEDVNSLMKYDRRINTPFSAGRQMAQDGNFACYTHDMKKTLGKIYGKEKVKSWTQNKVEETYKNLIAREINEIHRTNRMTIGTAKKKSKK